MIIFFDFKFYFFIHSKVQIFNYVEAGFLESGR